MQTLEFDLCIPDLNLQFLDLPLGLSFVKVVLALCEELLLRDREEVLISEAEVALNLRDLFA